MVHGPPPSSAGPSAYPQLMQTNLNHSNSNHGPGNVYGFSVHQPYANWPLQPSGAPYAATWYHMHPPAYHHPQQTYRESQIQTDAVRVLPERIQTPPPEFRRQWDAVFATFLKSAGLSQALKGFKDDIVVMNDDWERDTIPVALDVLVKELTALSDDTEEEGKPPKRSFEERKLEYIPAATGAQPQTPSTITKSISQFLAQSRRRNDASNRTEFLQSLSEKRRRLDANSDISSTAPTAASPYIPSCARTDARHLDRDVQMKYDIAKNEDGPLKRTMKMKREADDTLTEGDRAKRKKTERLLDGKDVKVEVTAERHPGLAERLGNVESHLAVRYVPSPPYSLLDRLHFLEDHIIQLEKEYPPWAALHFNQPNRGWPPPLRPTPLIVPSHLTSSLEPDTATPSAFSTSARTSVNRASTERAGRGRGRGSGGPKAKSSLHRAVMEKLEVQKAIGDLALVRD